MAAAARFGAAAGWATLRVGVFADSDGDGVRDPGEPFRPATLALSDADGDGTPFDLGLVSAPVAVRVNTAGGLHYLSAPALEANPVEGAAPWVALALTPGRTTEVLFAYPVLPPLRVALDGGEAVQLGGAPGPGLSTVVLSPPSAGSVFVDPAPSKYGGATFYRAPLGFEGEVRLVFAEAGADGAPLGLTQEVVVSVVQTPDAPDARDDGGFDPETGGVSYIVAQAGAPLAIRAADLLANDRDADGDALSVVAVGAASSGSVALSADGQTVLYTAPRGFAGGPATFAYTVRDAGGLTDTATVTVQVAPAPAAPTQTVPARGVAGPGDDLLVGTARADRLFGHGGDDLIRGGAGNDTLDGGAGADRLEGGAGDDALLGGEGRDTLDGGAGADRMRGGGGSDVFVLRAGEVSLAGAARLDAILDFGGAGGVNGDVVLLEGFGPGATLAFARTVAAGLDAGAHVYRVETAVGAAHEFVLVSYSGKRLDAGDYAFA